MSPTFISSGWKTTHSNPRDRARVKSGNAIWLSLVAIETLLGRIQHRETAPYGRLA